MFSSTRNPVTSSSPGTSASSSATKEIQTVTSVLQSTTSTLKTLLKKPSRLATKAMNSLYVPTLITGYVDDTPRLLGNPVIGVGNRYNSPLWLQEVVEDCEKEIQADEQNPGICRFFIFGNQAAYINDIDYIKKIYDTNPLENKDNVAPKNGETIGIYQLLFGESILTFAHTDPRWKKERQFLVDSLMSPVRLRTQEITLRKIAQEHLRSFSVQNAEELRTFGNRVILDMISQTQLHLFDITPEEKAQLIATVSAALPEMNSLKTAMNLGLDKELSKFAAWAGINKQSEWRFKMPLDGIKASGEKLIRHLLTRNRQNILKLHDDPRHNSLLMLRIADLALTEAETQLSQKTAANQLTSEDKEIQNRLNESLQRFESKCITEYQHLREKLDIFDIKPEDISLDSDAIQKFTAMVLFAGYETTSTLLFFCLLVLSDPQHQHIIEQVRKTTAPEARARLLDEIVREVGRLYPSFPIFKDLLTQDVQLEKNITLKEGTMLFYSPYILHRQKGGVSEPQPEKFMLGRKLDEIDKSYNFTIFGAKPRTCVGRKTALMEIVTLLSELLPQFTMTMDPRYSDPLPVEVCFGLRLAQEIDQKDMKITIKPAGMAEQKEMRDEMSTQLGY